MPDYGNHPIIAYSLEEEGMISKLFNKMPNLLFLTLSNAPNALFFEGQSHPLKYLRLDAGYFHENFILNLGQSNRFLNLRHLDFGEFNEQYLDKYPDECTPFDHYIALFQSKVFEKLNVFTLRNSVMTQEQIQELRLLNKNVDFNLVYSDKD